MIPGGLSSTWKGAASRVSANDTQGMYFDEAV